MTRDLALAFEHPEARATAMAGDNPRDRISLRDYIVEAEIGAFQHERRRTQRLRFNVVVEVRAKGDLADDVDRVLSYDRITEAIAAELAAERLNLLETLAERVAERVLAAPQAATAFVRIEKLDLGPGALGVEIVRSGAGPQAVLEAAAEPAPAVIFLSNEALVSDRLGSWLDEIAALGQSVILCLGLPDASQVKTGHRPTQARIDLLAIEQNAWALAARDARCIVVASRTELDWARGQGRISVWAPSKMVFDAGPDGPAPGGSPEALAAWLAGALGAARLIYVGADGPEGEHLAADVHTLL
ncbi:MAG: dihydroneopterin aldolase [Pseudomonadota bacterium]